ncbi:MAG TPA: histidine--tRNA ligase [Acidimicrobiales bacterium]|nr:histidine--tRNA ligase [Acidimicrobiales bacterium]
MSESVVPFKAPIGTHDVLGPESAQWEGLVAVFAELAYRYGFSLVMTPIFEDVGVFLRGIGEESDVFKKEMYVFTDRGERRYALRPEGTASVVRAFVQHQPTTPWKAWYVTPAFRYERPQKGRYRQHYQLGVEVLGTDDPAVDVEVIALAHRLYRAIGLTQVTLLINSMGHAECRAIYVNLLTQYLEEHQDELCDEHRELWRQNPLRVLDCKRDACINVTAKGPMLIDHLCDDCRSHFDRVLEGLAGIGIETTLAPRLVRGFDYYNRTTFEFVADAFESAQNSIGGGGRYDQLAEELGGKPTSGIGFGSGVERILLAREAEGVTTALLNRTLDVFVIDTTGDGAAATLVEELRSAGLATDRAYDQRSMKAQMKAADRSGARFAILIGPEELAAGEVTIRDLRSQDFDQTQRRVPRAETVATVADLQKK